MNILNKTVPWIFLVCSALAACGDEAAVSKKEHPPDLNPPGARWQQQRELSADLEAPRHPSDGGGRGRVVELDGEPLVEGSLPEVLAAGRHGFAIEYEVGPLGIAQGGALYFMPEPFWGWSSPQNVDPRRMGYVTMQFVEDGAAGLDFPPQRGPLIVAEMLRDVDAGEVLRIEYGVSGGAQVDLYAERGSRLWISVDGDGDGVRQVVDDSPQVDVLARPPQRIVAHVPSRLAPGTEYEVRLAVLDEAGNVTPEADGVFLVQPGDRRIELTPEERGATRLASQVAQEGVQRLQVTFTSAEDSFTCESNPLLGSPGARPLIWADLHGHSQLSDGTGTPEEYLRYARDVAALDAIALTDHDHYGVRFLDQRDDLWQGIREVTAAYHDPGRFVTLLGFEWTNWVHGHRHVIYFTEDGRPLSSLNSGTDDPAKLWEALEGQAALTLAHHSAGDPVPQNWTFRPDPVLEPVTEVMSVHGSSEAADSPSVLRGGRPGNFVRDVLDQGVVFGFIGSGDSHDGHPGLAHLNPIYGYLPPRGDQPASLGQGGLAALEAETTRASILAALRERRCYATSGPRIVLDTRLRGTATLDVHVVGTAPLERIELIRRGVVVRTWPGEGRLEWRRSQELQKAASGEYAYVRVVQVDRGLAWSSPIYLP